MAFADPITLDHSGDAVTLPRVGFTADGGSHRAANGEFELVNSHRMGSRVRHTIRLNHKKIVEDPLLEGVNRVASLSVIFTVDVPSDGFTPTEVFDVAAMLPVWLLSSSGVPLTKFLGGES